MRQQQCKQVNGHSETDRQRGRESERYITVYEK